MQTIICYTIIIKHFLYCSKLLFIELKTEKERILKRKKIQIKVPLDKKDFSAEMTPRVHRGLNLEIEGTTGAI